MDSEDHEIVCDNNNGDLIPEKNDDHTGQMYPGYNGKYTNKGLAPNIDMLKNPDFQFVDNCVRKTQNKTFDTKQHKESKTCSKVSKKKNMNRKTLPVPIDLSTNSVATANNREQHIPSAAHNTILPTLTDDMFVIESPSFILPYVYGKPSIISMKEFVANLGKELEEKCTVVDNENFFKGNNNIGKAVNKTEIDSCVPETNEVVRDLLSDKTLNNTVSKKHKYDDDPLWEESTSSDSEYETSPETVISNAKQSVFVSDVKDSLNNNSSELKNVNQCENYFDSSLGKFFMDISDNLVQEYVLNELMEQQKSKLGKENWSDDESIKLTKHHIISVLFKSLENSRNVNAPYKFNYKKCSKCSFKTESSLVMARHLEIPHLKKNVYNCNYCVFSNHKSQDVMYHMKVDHNTLARLDPPQNRYHCSNCAFKENNNRNFSRHQVACAKTFKAEHNLKPPVKWEPPAKLPTPPGVRLALASKQQAATMKTTTELSVPNQSSKTLTSSRNKKIKPVSGAPLLCGGQVHQPDPQMVPKCTFSLPSAFVVCEICDGYITNIDNLRHHMQFIHKIKINSISAYNGPQLNCQKCSFLFFTDQGLERHLLGSHSLVTSNMVKAAEEGKDSGRCPSCGKIFVWNLLLHMTQDHKMSLKLVTVNYKCKECEATFQVFEEFENHTQLIHKTRKNDTKKRKLAK